MYFYGLGACMKFISGWGWGLPVSLLLIILLVRQSLAYLFNDGYFYQHLWPKYLIVVLFSLFCLFIGYRKNLKKKILVIDADSGETLGAAPCKHQLLYFPVQYWALILPILFVLSYKYTDWWQDCRLPLLCF